MSNMIGGLLFLPRTSGVSLSRIGERVVNVLGVPELWPPPDAPFRQRKPVTTAKLAERLEHAPQVVCEFPQAQMTPLLTFETSATEYDHIRLDVDDANFSGNYYEEGAPVGPPNAFADQWLRLCAALEVGYGYFAPYNHMSLEEYVAETVLPALAARDIPTLEGINWLLYFGPDLAPLWTPPRGGALPTVTTTERFPSGALYVRRGVYPAPYVYPPTDA